MPRQASRTAATLKTPAGVERTPYPRRRLAAALAVAAGAGVAAAIHNRRRSRSITRDNPPAGAFIEVDGVRLHYVAAGEGEAVVLIHGNSVTLEDWRASGVFKRLAATSRVIAFDRPGYGHSSRPRGRAFTAAAQAELIGRALERLGVVRPVIVGHSFGAQVALAMGLQAPSRIAGLVLASGYYFPSLRLDSALSVPSALPLVGDVLDSTVQPFLARAMFPRAARAMFDPGPVPERFSLWPHAMASRPGQIRAQAEDGALMVVSAVALAAKADRLAVPAVVISGGADRIVAAADQSGRLARLVDARLDVVPGAGHMVHYADPDAIVRAAADVRAEVTASGTAPRRGG